MPPKVLQGFSFTRRGVSLGHDDQSPGGSSGELGPFLKLSIEKEIYRPGDLIIATIEIQNPDIAAENIIEQHVANHAHPILVENLAIEIKGIEKLDSQWFTTQKPLPGSKQRRGEQVFLDSTTATVVSKVILPSGSTKKYMIRSELPKVLPPSYRGTAIRYLYYIKSTLSCRRLVYNNGHSSSEFSRDLIQLEARTPVHIWIMANTGGLFIEEDQNDGILPAPPFMLDVHWKEKDADSEWDRANESSHGIEDGYDSSRDEISSVASYSHTKGNLEYVFQNSLSLQSSAPAMNSWVKASPYHQGERSSFRSFKMPTQLATSEVLYEPNGNVPSPCGISMERNYSLKKMGSYPPSTILSPSQQRKYPSASFTDDEMGAFSTPGNVEPVASEGYIRGRSYNIRMDDQVLLRFSPKNSDSTYYFGDMIGGTLTFAHEEGSRRCLEVSITLETSESISQPFVHPSRRSSPTITKIQWDHHEVVADLLQTSFLFSIPMDGPMSFSTPRVSVQWALHFEFFTTPKDIDWTRYDHPLLIERREKGEWVLPITVHAPPPQTQSAQTRRERPSSPTSSWLRS
ncbi:uncharacterized protein LOC18439782 [Amborella trichopoda]|uniref:Uncharacterized protein n=1 Tax=Amborella trichopoda TaxID=13333 RepID=W1PUS8_AMBTC|nr:uncharacterized protein LOC18439782 [Amborella trichopoda]XP_020526462.1 uncharacterized protein LOC18439782 [Amborella trichopoda]XP_020526463.1 uncharacterized protein LOC18439782 [Amborella trichopoda]ERN11584.1 hypothetical protein AMTR_s00022p00174260 [Amborella trichopoda]|eukprot:XP_006850003.1 uncharacterized protein LOC18439782 [Amborella trichopoda]